MIGLLKNLAHKALGQYELYRIYEFDLVQSARPPTPNGVKPVTDVDELRFHVDPEIRALCPYHGEDAFGFALEAHDEIVAVCYYWTGERYRRERNFWPLKLHEGKLVQITTAAAHRGKGYAQRLITGSACHMAERGYQHLYARIWHTNEPSIKAFRKAGWRQKAFVTVLYPFGAERGIRIVL